MTNPIYAAGNQQQLDQESQATQAYFLSPDWDQHCSGLMIFCLFTLHQIVIYNLQQFSSANITTCPSDFQIEIDSFGFYKYSHFSTV